MKKTGIYVLFTVFFLISCKNDDNGVQENPAPADTFIRAADISFLPEIEATGFIFKNNGQPEGVISTLKNSGCNTIRIRLWHSPATAHSGMAEVKALAQRVKAAGMKVWLTIHYSDTWADPGQQQKPAAWANLTYPQLLQAVAAYTQQAVAEIQPDIVQIGNEVNDGFLYPDGQLSVNQGQYLQLVAAAAAAVRQQLPDAKIMLHYAGVTGADYYFDKTAGIDYDYIGLSYYPIWHGADLNTLQSTITALGQQYNKKVLVAETAYPFTLGWNDWTNNIVGDGSQILPGYAATPQGQLAYVNAVKQLVRESGTGIGFCYWGAEWVAYRGAGATNGSTWENQALWDFNGNALPVLQAFIALQ